MLSKAEREDPNRIMKYGGKQITREEFLVLLDKAFEICDGGIYILARKLGLRKEMIWRWKEQGEMPKEVSFLKLYKYVVENS